MILSVSLMQHIFSIAGFSLICECLLVLFMLRRATGRERDPEWMAICWRSCMWILSVRYHSFHAGNSSGEDIDRSAARANLQSAARCLTMKHKVSALAWLNLSFAVANLENVTDMNGLDEAWNQHQAATNASRLLLPINTYCYFVSVSPVCSLLKNILMNVSWRGFPLLQIKSHRCYKRWKCRFHMWI